MQRINTTNKATDLFGPGKHGYRAGNPATGQSATELSADVMNSLQEEIAGVIEGANIALVPGNNAQLIAAITALIASGVFTQAAADARYASSFFSIGATVASNALTATLNPCKLDFRSAVLASGVSNNRSVGAALSLVVPNGATLGTKAATAARLVLLAIDNAGVVELAVTNLGGGVNLDETTLISTIAISAAATAENIIYSTTARTSVPFRMVGFIDITEAAAGTWATAPTMVQGVGGNALSAIGSLGYGQTWQIVSRSLNTNYTNTTGKPICCSVGAHGAPNNCVIGAIVNGISLGYQGVAAVASASMSATIEFIVPPGATYMVRNYNGASLGSWSELR